MSGRRRAIAFITGLVAAVAVAPAGANAADIASQVSAGIGASSSFTGGGQTCIVTAAKVVRCWGGWQQTGVEPPNQSAKPAAVAGVANAVEVETGGDHACARVTSGDVYCWGDNGFGQIGADPESTAASKTALKVAGISGATRIATGAQHTCALLADGTVRCWGNGGFGVLGVGDANGDSSFTPLQVKDLTDAVAISAGAFHTCAMRESGTSACWGVNDSGQLGNGSLEWAATPTTVAGLNGVAQVSAGATSTCATLTEGKVKCWGDNSYGTIGDGTTTNRPTPTTVSGIGDATSVSVGDSFACSRLSSGSVKCWGVTDPLNQWCEVASGSLKNCFSIVDWFDRSSDPGIEIAINPAAVSLLPVVLGGVSDAASIAAGDRHLCILRANNALTCSGLNSSGQLGNGKTTPSSTPVAVQDLGYVVLPPALSGVPVGFVRTNTATITLTGEPQATFTCKLDKAKAATCKSPLKLTKLADGLHTLTVTQKNKAGLTSAATTATWTVDTKAPAAPKLEGTPPAFTNATTATVTPTGEAQATFTCTIDGAAPAPCPNPVTLTALTDGPHTVTVTQTDQAGNTSPAATSKWTVDTIAPQAPVITSSPTSPLRSQKATLTFTGESGAGFACSLNAVDFSPCTSPLVIDGLADGLQQLAVRQIDRAGNTSQAMTASWTVEATPPAAPGLEGVPVGFVKTNSATITLTGEPQATFTCKLDKAKAATCKSPLKLTKLSDGLHTLTVTQKNKAGLTSAATTATWTVDTKAPAAPKLEGTPPAFTNATTATVTPTGEAQATFTCTIDGAAPAPCPNPVTLTALTDGPHTVTVTQTDQAGNTSPAATSKWTVDTIAPSLTRKVAGYIKRTAKSTSISLLPAKDPSGIASVEYSVATAAPAPTANPVTTSVVKYASPVVITRSVAVGWLRIRDGAGNWCQWYSATATG